VAPARKLEIRGVFRRSRAGTTKPKPCAIDRSIRLGSSTALLIAPHLRNTAAHGRPGRRAGAHSRQRARAHRGRDRAGVHPRRSADGCRGDAARSRAACNDGRSLSRAFVLQCASCACSCARRRHWAFRRMYASARRHCAVARTDAADHRDRRGQPSCDRRAVRAFVRALRSDRSETFDVSDHAWRKQRDDRWQHRHECGRHAGREIRRHAASSRGHDCGARNR
jgi:hypothetical protein